MRVLIGEAKGQNWWCVVFPPLCTAAAEDVPEAAQAAGLSAEQVQLITCLLYTSRQPGKRAVQQKEEQHAPEHPGTDGGG